MSADVQSSRTLSDAVAEEIRVMLVRRRMSGRELARKLEVSPGWVSYRLTGTQPIDLNDLQRIAAVLGVNAIDLLPKRPSDATPGERKPIDPLAQRVIATVGEPHRHATPTRAHRAGRLDEPPRPARKGHDRRPMALLAPTGRNLATS